MAKLVIKTNTTIGKLHDAAVANALKAANSWKNKLKSIFSFGNASDDALIFNSAFYPGKDNSLWAGPNKNYYIEFVRSGFFNKSKLNALLKEYMKWFAGIPNFNAEEYDIKKMKYGIGSQVWRLWYDMPADKMTPNVKSPYANPGRRPDNSDEDETDFAGAAGDSNTKSSSGLGDLAGAVGKFVAGALSGSKSSSKTAAKKPATKVAPKKPATKVAPKKPATKVAPKKPATKPTGKKPTSRPAPKKTPSKTVAKKPATKAVPKKTAAKPTKKGPAKRSANGRFVKASVDVIDNIPLNESIAGIIESADRIANNPYLAMVLSESDQANNIASQMEEWNAIIEDASESTLNALNSTSPIGETVEKILPTEIVTEDVNVETPPTTIMDMWSNASAKINPLH